MYKISTAAEQVRQTLGHIYNVLAHIAAYATACRPRIHWQSASPAICHTVSTLLVVTAVMQLSAAVNAYMQWHNAMHLYIAASLTDQFL